MLLPIRFIDNYLLRNIICNFLICLSAMAERHILLFSRPSCRAFVSLPAAGIKWSFPCCPAAGPWGSCVLARGRDCRELALLPRGRAVGLSAQLAYKSSFPFRKHRNSRPPICVSGPFHLQKLVVASKNRNWSRGRCDIDPRPRQLCHKGAASPRQDNKKGASYAPLQILHLKSRFLTILIHF